MGSASDLRVPPWCRPLPRVWVVICACEVLIVPLRMVWVRGCSDGPAAARKVASLALMTCAIRCVIGGAFNILPARFLNRGLVRCMAMMVASFLRTLLPSILLFVPSRWALLSDWVNVCISFCLKLVMRALFPGAVTTPMKDRSPVLQLDF